MVVTCKLWQAPLRGVTIRAFRETFAAAIREANWHLLSDATGGTPVVPVNGQDARSPSQFWHAVDADETACWLELLLRTKYLSEAEYQPRQLQNLANSVGRAVPSPQSTPPTQDNCTISQISESSICTPPSTPMSSHVIVVMPNQ